MKWIRASDRQPTDDDYPIVTKRHAVPYPPVVITTADNWSRNCDENWLWISTRDVDWYAGLPTEIEELEPATVEVDGVCYRTRWDGGIEYRLSSGVWKDYQVDAGSVVHSGRLALTLGLLNADESPDPEPAAPVLSDSEERFLREAASWVERKKPYTATDRYHAGMLRRIADRLGGPR